MIFKVSRIVREAADGVNITPPLSPGENTLSAHIDALLRVALRRAAVLTRPLHGAPTAGGALCLCPRGGRVEVSC